MTARRGHGRHPLCRCLVTAATAIAALLPASALGQLCDGDSMSCETVSGCTFDWAVGAGACRPGRCDDLDGNEMGCLGSALGCEFTFTSDGTGACHLEGEPVSCISYPAQDCRAAAARCRLEGRTCLATDAEVSCFK